MPERETIKCLNPKCKLVQFRTARDLCRRCKESTAPKPEPEPVVLIEVRPDPVASHANFTRAIQLVLLARRGRIPQRQLARKIGCPRTYVSKVERGRVTPTLSSLDNYARGLGIPLWVAVKEIEAMRDILATAQTHEVKP